MLWEVEILISSSPHETWGLYFMISWAPSSEFVSSSIPSWQILTAHAQPFREARDLAFCLKVPLDSLLVWASSGGSGETARMRRLAWTFAARICDKYQIRLKRSSYGMKYECFGQVADKTDQLLNAYILKTIRWTNVDSCDARLTT